MLVREGESLDLQEVSLAEQAVNVDGQGVRREFGVESGTQAPKGVGMIGFDVELVVELAIDGFDNLADVIDEVAGLRRELFFLILPRQGVQADAIEMPQFSGFGGTDISFVANDGQVGMVEQQVKTHVQVGGAGGSQGKVDNHPTQGDQQVELVAKDRYLFGGHLAEMSMCAL